MVLKTWAARCPNQGGLVDTITGHMCPRCTPYPGDTLAARLQHPAQRSKMTRPNKGPNRRSRGIIRGSNIPINQPAHKHSPELFQFHLRLSFPPRKLISTSPPTCGPHLPFWAHKQVEVSLRLSHQNLLFVESEHFQVAIPSKSTPPPSNLEFHLKCASKMSSLQSRTWNHPSSTKIGLFKVIAKLDTIRTTRRHRLHDDGKGFGAGEMIHLLPRLTLKTKRRHKNASKHNCVCVCVLFRFCTCYKKHMFNVSSWGGEKRNHESTKTSATASTSVTTHGAYSPKARCLDSILLHLFVPSILHTMRCGVATQTHVLGQGICHLNKDPLLKKSTLTMNPSPKLEVSDIILIFFNSSAFSS